jgi:hypothetical protein
VSIILYTCIVLVNSVSIRVFSDAFILFCTKEKLEEELGMVQAQQALASWQGKVLN